MRGLPVSLAAHVAAAGTRLRRRRQRAAERVRRSELFFLGAAFMLLEEGLSRITELWKMIFGPMLILIVLFARGGILGLFRGLRRG